MPGLKSGSRGSPWDGEQVPPAQGGPRGPAPCSLGGPKPQLQVHPHPTPALDRDSSVQVTSMTSSQSRSATRGLPLQQCWGRRPGGGSRQPQGGTCDPPCLAGGPVNPARHSAPAGGTSPVAGVASGFAPREEAGPPPTKRTVLTRPAFTWVSESRCEGSRQSTGVSEDTAESRAAVCRVRGAQHHPTPGGQSPHCQSAHASPRSPGSLGP